MTKPRLPEEGEYKVGYRRPPVATRFKLGQSGNPKGRPKRGKDLGTILENALNTLVDAQQNGARRKITMREVIVHRLIADAARGDTRAMRMLLAWADRYLPHAGPVKEAMPLPDEDNAIIGDFLKRYRPAAPEPNATGTNVLPPAHPDEIQARPEHLVDDDDDDSDR